MIPEPTLARLRKTLRVDPAAPRTDPSLEAFVRATAGAPDLRRRPHRAALLVWLNAWGCRIRSPRPGEPSPFDTGVARWWREWSAALPRPTITLADLSHADIAVLSDAYRELVAVVVARNAAGHARTMGPTAAAKSLYALRPRAVMPWDAAIADALHGARTAEAFAAHLRLGRSWVRTLLRSTGLDEDALLALLGRSGSTLARVLDEYCYVAATRGVRGAAIPAEYP